MEVQFWTMVFYTAFGYFSGNMLYAYWLPKWLRGVDVRDYGADHNPGAANAFKACGWPMGLVCVALDLLKAAGPVLAARYLGGLHGIFLAPVAAAPVVGHAFPVLFHMPGGKAIAASFGALLGLFPESRLALLWAGCILVLLPFKMPHRQLIRRAAIAMMGICCVLIKSPGARLTALAIGGVLVWKHRPQSLAEMRLVKRKA